MVFMNEQSRCRRIRRLNDVRGGHKRKITPDKYSAIREELLEFDAFFRCHIRLICNIVFLKASR